MASSADAQCTTPECGHSVVGAADLINALDPDSDDDGTLADGDEDLDANDDDCGCQQQGRSVVPRWWVIAGLIGLVAALVGRRR